MTRTCSVPGCKSNDAQDAFCLLMFPTDPGRRKLWIRAINRTGFQPTNTSTICVKHFEKHCIEYSSIRVKRNDGKEFSMLNKIPRLKDDAYPTIFENVLSNSLITAQKRKLPDEPSAESNQAPVKILSHSSSILNLPAHSVVSQWSLEETPSLSVTPVISNPRSLLSSGPRNESSSEVSIVKVVKHKMLQPRSTKKATTYVTKAPVCTTQPLVSLGPKINVKRPWSNLADAALPETPRTLLLPNPKVYGKSRRINRGSEAASIASPKTLLKTKTTEHLPSPTEIEEPKIVPMGSPRTVLVKKPLGDGRPRTASATTQTGPLSLLRIPDERVVQEENGLDTDDRGPGQSKTNYIINGTSVEDFSGPKSAKKILMFAAEEISRTKRKLGSMELKYSRAVKKIETLMELLKNSKDGRGSEELEETQVKVCSNCHKVNVYW